MQTLKNIDSIIVLLAYVFLAAM